MAGTYELPHFQWPPNERRHCSRRSRRRIARVYALFRELVKRFVGTIDSQKHITMGGASIEQDGSLLVTTSLIPIGVPYLTKEGFQRVWIRVPNVDDPWSDTGTPAPGGGFTLLPAPLTSPLWSGRVLGGGEMVNVPLVFSAPAASAYLIRFVASAGAADIRVRAGTPEAPAILTL